MAAGHTNNASAANSFPGARFAAEKKLSKWATSDSPQLIAAALRQRETEQAACTGVDCSPRKIRVMRGRKDPPQAHDVDRFHETNQTVQIDADPTDLILRSRALARRLEGWLLARPCPLPSFETCARARSSG